MSSAERSRLDGALARDQDQALAQPPGEAAAGVGLGRPRGIGRLVHQHARAALANQLLDQLRAQTGRIGEAVDPDGAGGKRRIRVANQRLARRAQQQRTVTDAFALHRFETAHRDTRDRERGLARGRMRVGGFERVEHRLGAIGVESRVEQVRHRGLDRRVAVDEPPEPLAQQRLVGREPAHQHREERIGGGRPGPAAFEDLEREREEGLHEDAGACSPACATSRSPT